MSYIVNDVQNQLREAVLSAAGRAVANNAFPAVPLSAFNVEIPSDRANGDFSTNAAMAWARDLHMAPKKIAETVISNISLDGTYFARCECAGPGFLNFYLDGSYYSAILKDVKAKGKDYGRSDFGKGKRINVEFVSANPTGPMHMGNARGGALGDCLAAVLDYAGYNVEREFYINDAGNQVDKFAHSVEGRYIQQLKGEDAIEFDASWYQGADIKELAADLIQMHGDKLLEMSGEERRKVIVEYGLPTNIARMQRDLERYKIHYDVWFRESGLHSSGYVEETVKMLADKGATYEKEGALWLRSTDFGCEKDDVLRRANGFYTYFAADIAYHRNKFEKRGFDRVINIWGADHHGHVHRLQSALDALGLDGSHRLEIVLMQLVRMMQGGEVVRMSKRTGKSLTLSDLLDEIPVDAARYFFNSRAAETQMEFDLDLAVKQDSDNPLYYCQYAHARICSLLRKMEEEGVTVPEQADLTVLSEEEELALVKQISLLPEEIIGAAADRDPSRLNKYAVALCAQFHRFYNACRIKEAEDEVRDARLVLCRAARQTIYNVLTMIGVEAPEHM